MLFSPFYSEVERLVDVFGVSNRQGQVGEIVKQMVRAKGPCTAERRNSPLGSVLPVMQLSMQQSNR